MLNEQQKNARIDSTFPGIFYSTNVNHAFGLTVTSMAKKTKEEAAKTRQLLIDTAILTFAQQGFSNTTLDDIACAANMTRGAIYWHFTNKTELFNAIWQEQRPLRERIDRKARLHFSNDPQGLFRHSLTEALRLIATSPFEQALVEILYHKCEFTQNMTSEAEIRERLFFNPANVAEMLEKCLQQDPQFLSGSVETALIIIQGYLSGIVKNWLMLGKCFDLAALAPQLVDGLLVMLRTTPEEKNVKLSA